MLNLLETRASLILRLPDPADLTAWDEFVRVYSPLIYRIGRRQGLQPADSEDLVQDVLATVTRKVEDWLQKSERGPFRAWLFSIARNTAINLLTRQRSRTLAAGGDASVQVLSGLEAPDELESLFDSEYRHELFRHAAAEVRGSVTSSTWTAFTETALRQRAVSYVASELGMTEGAVYIARSRVMARLRAIVQRFEEQGR